MTTAAVLIYLLHSGQFFLENSAIKGKFSQSFKQSNATSLEWRNYFKKCCFWGNLLHLYTPTGIVNISRVILIVLIYEWVLF